jgi:hypothetical protein
MHNKQQYHDTGGQDPLPAAHAPDAGLYFQHEKVYPSPYKPAAAYARFAAEDTSD